MIPIPRWMQDSIDCYDQRVEMLVCAFVTRYQRIPVLVVDNEGEFARVVFIHPTRTADEPPCERLLELARHASRAWDIWTDGAEPLTALLTLRCQVNPTQVSVLISRRTRDVELAVAARAEASQTLDQKWGVQ